MKTKIHADGPVLRRMPDYHVKSSPNSSALFGITTLASTDDILAAVRTAVLLGKTFRAAVSVGLFGEELMHVEPSDTLSEAALLLLLASIRDKIRQVSATRPTQFALEATWTNASFISAGLLSLSVHETESASQSPAVER